MNPIIKNILAVVAGCLIGGVVNMGIIMISGSIIPPPNGADVTTVEGLKASMHLFHPINFVMPFLAHSLGTFAGALLAALIAANRKMIFALVVGLFFLAGGITDVYLLPAPAWFAVLDLAGAYIPFAYFAGKIITREKK